MCNTLYSTTFLCFRFTPRAYSISAYWQTYLRRHSPSSVPTRHSSSCPSCPGLYRPQGQRPNKEQRVRGWGSSTLQAAKSTGILRGGWCWEKVGLKLYGFCIQLFCTYRLYNSLTSYKLLIMLFPVTPPPPLNVLINLTNFWKYHCIKRSTSTTLGKNCSTGKTTLRVHTQLHTIGR